MQNRAALGHSGDALAVAVAVLAAAAAVVAARIDHKSYRPGGSAGRLYSMTSNRWAQSCWQ